MDPDCAWRLWLSADGRRLRSGLCSTFRFQIILVQKLLVVSRWNSELSAGSVAKLVGTAKLYRSRWCGRVKTGTDGNLRNSLDGNRREPGSIPVRSVTKPSESPGLEFLESYGLARDPNGISRSTAKSATRQAMFLEGSDGNELSSGTSPNTLAL